MIRIDKQNQGTALITALVLLMALTIISMSGMHVTTSQLLLSSNDEATVTANEFAQSVIDEVIETPSAFVVGSSNGYTICTSSETGCNENSISLSSSMFSSTNVGARVELLKIAAAPRLLNGNSASITNGAYFKITGKYDDTGNDGGKSTIVQGFVMLLPTGQ